jgi:hypothetical protein
MVTGWNRRRASEIVMRQPNAQRQRGMVSRDNRRAMIFER